MPQGQDGEKYYLPDDMAGKTIEWLHGVRAQDAAKPWFVYYATGCAHAPHHVPQEWAAKYKGRFDGGWDAYREQTFERQKQLGVIPADAELTPRNEAFPAWDSLPEEQQAAVRAADGGVRRVLRERRLEPRAGSSPRSRRWASWTTRW